MADNNCESDAPGPSRGRKKTLKPEEWKQNVAKKKRNLGEEYVSRKTGALIPAKVMGPPCSDGCYDKIPLATRQDMFKEFWEIGDFTLQNSYLQKQVKQVPVKRHRIRKTKTQDNPRKMRSCMLQCTLTISGTSYSVCKQGFLNILGIKKGRVDTALKAAGTPQTDKRGRHPQARTIGGDVLQYVKDHIHSFLTVSSHYTRAKSPHHRNLETNLTVKKMYRMYVKQMKNEHHPTEDIVKESFYRNLFNTTFKPPKTDTCSKTLNCVESE
ncbi:hypothetical protein Pmani_028513 [Petrolisthes manimaculis]|uniref:Uncharacterized protein n=1 Tax=Petrolisthes manimaculis TaxID=1843537 RepID=A0AAE1TY05_9EUCA|nr:hypothetical protein Pmani_028513 [Petrolisthes manimaculis]